MKGGKGEGREVRKRGGMERGGEGSAHRTIKRRRDRRDKRTRGTIRRREGEERSWR